MALNYVTSRTVLNPERFRCLIENQYYGFPTVDSTANLLADTCIYIKKYNQSVSFDVPSSLYVQGMPSNSSVQFLTLNNPQEELYMFADNFISYFKDNVSSGGGGVLAVQFSNNMASFCKSDAKPLVFYCLDFKTKTLDECAKTVLTGKTIYVAFESSNFTVVTKSVGLSYNPNADASSQFQSEQHAWFIYDNPNYFLSPSFIHPCTSIKRGTKLLGQSSNNTVLTTTKSPNNTTTAKNITTQTSGCIK